MEPRYFILCNGYCFETREGQLLNYLDTLNPEKRILIRREMKGQEIPFETVRECMEHYSRQFHNENATRVQEAMNW